VESHLQLDRLDVLMDGDEEVVPENNVPTDPSASQRDENKEADAPFVRSSVGFTEVNADIEDSDYDDRPKKSKGRRGQGRPKSRVGKMRTKSRERYECAFPNCMNSYAHKRSRQYHYEREHMHLHQQDRIKFTCGQCSRVFSHRRLLASHSITHSKEKNYRCDVCLKLFKTA